MIIAIEGVDGAGKTTLAAKLQDFLLERDAERGVELIHSGPPTKPALEEYELSLRDYDPDGMHLILDRWHWGELVYGPIYRGKSELGNAGLWHVDKFLESRGAVMLLAEETPEVIRERLGSRGEDFLKDEHIELVLKSFEAVYEHSVMADKYRLNATEHPEEIFSAGLIGYQHEGMAKDLMAFPTYVGPRYPEFLLLGEKRKDPSWPSAFVPGNTTSGKFLLDALSPNVRNHCGLANACEEDVLTMYATLNAPRTCTLGKLAGKAADAAGIPHFNVPHPQYIRRFHNSKQREYGQVIARGLYGEEVENWPS